MATGTSLLNLEPARPMMVDIYQRAAPCSLSLLVISSTKDAALFVRDFEALFVAKTREVVIMGGAKAPRDDASHVLLEPDSAHNNCFDKAASDYFYRRCQELGVLLVVVSRHAAMAAQVPRTLYDELAETGSPIAWRLRNSQRDKIEELWQRACGEDDATRRGLPARCDRKWFIKTFCGGGDDPERTGTDTVWDLVKCFQQYDSVALLAAIPALRERYFTPRRVQGPLKTNLLIGEETDPGVQAPEQLIDLMKQSYITGLTLNHKSKVHVIVVVQLHEENTNGLSDLRLMLVEMRALWGVGVLDCVGILVSSSAERAQKPTAFTSRVSNENSLGHAWAAGNRSVKLSRRQSLSLESSDAVLHEHARELAAMLAALGMSHVRVCVDDPFDSSHSSADWLTGLYEEAPPSGVTLVMTSTATAVASFVREQPDLFRAKTRGIVHMSGASVVIERDEHVEHDEHEESVARPRLEPDLEATNNRLDTASAIFLFREAQRLSVPMIILSRHAAKTCRIPAALFDELGKYAGRIGSLLRDEQKEVISRLWERIHAQDCGGLPSRISKEWFSATFCNGKATEKDRSAWEQVDEVMIYNPLVLLAAIPAVEERYFASTRVKVRSATHKIIGMHAHEGACMRDGQLEPLHELMYCALFNGATANASEFEPCSGVAKVALSIGGSSPAGSTWSFNPGTTLQVLRELLK